MQTKAAWRGAGVRAAFGRVAAACALVLAALLLAWGGGSARADQAVALEEGCGGVRIITSYYSVFLEDRLFPDGFAYEYIEELDGAFAVLNIYAATELQSDGTEIDEASSLGSGSGYPAYRIYCTAADVSTSPFLGTYAVATCTAVADGEYTVCVARPYGQGFSSSASAQEDDDGYGSALRAATTMCGHLCLDTQTYLVFGSSTIDIVTPWYTVSIPDGLFPNGWYYTYSDEVCVSLDGQGSLGRVLSVVPIAEDEAAFHVCCVKDSEVEGEVVQAIVGVFEGDLAGWQVVMWREADYAQSSVEEELAALQPYADLVSALGVPSEEAA